MDNVKVKKFQVFFQPLHTPNHDLQQTRIFHKKTEFRESCTPFSHKAQAKIDAICPIIFFPP